MQRVNVNGLAAAMLILSIAQTAHAQLRRSGSPGGEQTPSAKGVARDPRFPYAGLWSGTRTMTVGSDEISFQFSVADGAYSGVTLHRGGGTAPQQNLAATAAGLTWEQPNSGGGTWLFRVRLAGPDSMVGTLVLRDPPPNLTPAPTGTMILTRQPAGRQGEK
jgi:hypothetical protein